MIQELISTSAPRCLDGNAGFGIVAQTQGMSPNVSRVVNALSGYTHIAAPGSVKNPVIYLHAIRQTGGMLLHIISRIADCGNDYSGRSNRIAHHWIIEEGDIRSLPGGPAELTAQNIFRSQWTEKPSVLPPRTLSSTDVVPKKCTAWEQMTGDAGWGGIVAERAEKRDPISIIFSPEQSGIHLRTLIGEALGLLPSSVRWGITFCTYSMKSHEAGGGKIQIKCFLAGSEESQFARQSPDTLVIDLRQRQGAAPAGKYVELARGTVKPPPSVPTAGTSAPSDTAVRNALQQVASKKSHAEEVFHVEHVGSRHYAKPKSKNWKIYLSYGVLILLVLGLGAGLLQQAGKIARMQDERDSISVELKKEEELHEETRGELGEKERSLVLNAENLRQEREDKEKAQEKVRKHKQTIQDRDKEIIENKRRAIAYNLSQIQARWEGLVLHSGKNNDEPLTLEDTDFLNNDDFRDNVKIEYDPFVDLKSPKTHEKISDITFYVDDSKLPMIFKLSYTYHPDLEKDENDELKIGEDGDPVMKLVKRSKFEIARIELTGSGLQFTWIDDVENRDTLEHYTENEAWFQIKNRILLAKLKISIGNASRKIDLWTPEPMSISTASRRGDSPTMRVIADDESNYLFELTTTTTSSPFPWDQTTNLDDVSETKINTFVRPSPQQEILKRTYLVNPDGDDLLLFREIRESK